MQSIATPPSLVTCPTSTIAHAGAEREALRDAAHLSVANHYHFVAHSPAEGGAQNLSQMLGVLPKRIATWVNRLDGDPWRKVWHNFRETRLTCHKSYLARLNYTHQNPVKHGLVRVANQYPWCSAGWLEQTAPPGQVKTIYSFGIEHVQVYDEFDVEPEAWEK